MKALLLATLATAVAAADPWEPARLAADQGRWAAAASAAARAIDWTRCSADEAAFLAGTAIRAGDERLAAAVILNGVLRHPDDRPLRRLELALFVRADRPAEARRAALALLAAQPADADLWRDLAWASEALDRPGEALAALEIAVAAAPDDRGLRLRLATAQTAAGQPAAALAHWRRLLADPVEPRWRLAAARCAGDAGRPDEGRVWLAQVPDAERGRDHRLLTARLALQAGDAGDARAVLAPLVAAGEDDPEVLLWAGGIAERAGDPALAEACWRRARDRRPAATLRLAALCLRQDRRDEAAALLAAHLAAHPEDAAARALADGLR